MKTYLISVLLSLLSLSQIQNCFAENNNSGVGLELKKLDNILKQRNSFIDRRQARIDSIRTLKQQSEKGSLDHLLLVEKLGDSYSAFNNDSTLHYYRLGLLQSTQYGNDSMATVFRIKGATYLPLSGFVNEGVSMMNYVDTTSLSPKLRMLYLENARQMYSYIASFYRRTPDVKEYYQALSRDYQKKIIDNADYNSHTYALNRGEYLYETMRYSEAESVLSNLISKLSSKSNLYARACHILSSIAAANGDSDRRIEYLAKSAAADVEGATLEVVSLQELGRYLYNHGDVDRAYYYLHNALQNAVDCNAELRMLEVSSALPIIEQAYTASVSTQRRNLTIMLTALAVLLIIIAIILYYINRERNRVEILKLNLEQANRTKDVYLGQFMNMCSTYMERLISFNKVVNRKVSAGKTEDLLKLTKSEKFVEEQAAEFYQAFDEAFLHIYPNFVRDVNKLMLPGEQIEPEEGEKLNTNLRILAFMRLGMDDAAKTAQIMNYSVNTIYAYRNRLRNKAKNRETFEQDIMKILGI